MDQKIVRKLEEKLDAAIAEVIADMGLKKLPLLPSHQTRWSLIGIRIPE